MNSNIKLILKAEIHFLIVQLCERTPNYNLNRIEIYFMD